MEYIYYAAYMVAIVIYALGEFEAILPFRLFTAFDPEYYWHSRHAMPMFALFLYYRFARAFLNLPDTRPLLNKWVVRLEYFMLAYGIISPVLILSGMSIRAEEILFVSVSAIVMVSTVFIIISFLKKSVPLARFAMLGAAFILAGCLVTLIALLLQSSGYSLSFDPFVPQLVCVVAELLTFTTGLSFKARLIEQEKRLAEHALVMELKERQKLEGNMHQLRNKIAGDLHDDVGATLSGISIYAEVAKNSINANKAGEAVEYLERIYRHSNEMQKNLREMLWVINPGNDSIEALWDKMHNYGKPLLAACSIASVFQKNDALHDKKLSILQRRNMFLIFKECINNIVKHAECNNVNLCLENGENQISLTITDDGKGFDAKGTMNGNGLQNLESRVKELNGSFIVSSNSGEGTTMKFEIPLQYSSS